MRQRRRKFFGTTIAVNILVLSKHKTDTKTQLIDASGLFKKETNNNVLLDTHIEQIMQVFDSEANVAYFPQSVPFEKVAVNDYNLSVSSYVILAVWPASTFGENMAWLAESLGTKGNETPDETIRRYLASSFFKDHLQTYKKRPIYWLFSSGKQGAFQALVYLHRYHEGTLARMRAEYVVPLTGKMQSRIEMLEKDKDTATSTAARNKIAKQIESLKKKHVELLAYDEKLRHYADRRISLDLDDGVKVNYGKFGDLLAEVKAVSGGASDD